MKVLFFFVHPAKYHLFKNTFRIIEQSGNQYDVVIASKDVLAGLLQAGGVPFTDLFPKGRKIKGLPAAANAAIGLIRTLWGLYLFTRKKNYDVFVTDDVLSFLGKARKIPTIVFTDNDLVTIPKVKSIFTYADRIIAPESTDLGKYTAKKIPFRGHKALAHLHPKYFTPNPATIKKYGLEKEKICILRLAKLNANHDLHGNPGITDQDADEIISMIAGRFRILLVAERSVPASMQKFQARLDPIDMPHILAHASFFIGDSGTMAAEAAVLGVPNILINNIARKCGVHIELRDRYKIHEFFDSFPEGRTRFSEMLNDDSLAETFRTNATTFILEADDFNQILFQSIMAESKK